LLEQLNHQHTGCDDWSAQNVNWHLLTLALDISQTM